MSTDQRTLVRVTRDHIENGVIGSCERCAIALALQEATGDKGATVYDNGPFYLEVHGRRVEAPQRAVSFICDFDGLPRGKGGRAIIDAVSLADRPDVAPFEFTLPPSDSGEWVTDCDNCGEMCAIDELDEDGFCKDCRGSADD